MNLSFIFYWHFSQPLHLKYNFCQKKKIHAWHSFQRSLIVRYDHQMSIGVEILFGSTSKVDPPDKGENRLGSRVASTPKTQQKSKEKAKTECDSWRIAHLLEVPTEMY